jgi:hypothetical protein
MERERCRRQAKAFPDLPGRKSVRPRLHQQPEDIEARRLSECRQSGSTDGPRRANEAVARRRWLLNHIVGSPEQREGK